METQPDFKELLVLFNARHVEYLIVGGYALAFHGAPRFTGDLDIFVKPDSINAQRILHALEAFGFASVSLTASDFEHPDQVVQLGVPPVRIDLITSLTGVSWDEAWIDHVLDAARQYFGRGFDRWRELYRAATRQLLEAQNALLRARRPDEQAQTTARQQEALRQRNLLLQVNTTREENDFYPYRYLASEGFLPGYNFPALPIRAWVPRDEGEFVARPRFLAWREFAPGNILYHEGAKWEVVRFLRTPPGGLDERRICEATYDLCPTCQTRFDGDNSVLTTLLSR